jgi:hypothetical protein
MTRCPKKEARLVGQEVHGTTCFRMGMVVCDSVSVESIQYYLSTFSLGRYFSAQCSDIGVLWHPRAETLAHNLSSFVCDFQLQRQIVINLMTTELA